MDCTNTIGTILVTAYVFMHRMLHTLQKKDKTDHLLCAECLAFMPQKCNLRPKLCNSLIKFCALEHCSDCLLTNILD